MNSNKSTIPQKIRKDSFIITNIVNIIILLSTIIQGYLFYINEIKPLFYYCCLNIFLIIIATLFLFKKKNKIYVNIIFLGIFIYMFLCVIFLGWDYGFQQYCLGFVSSYIFTDFYVNRNKQLSKKTLFLVSSNVVFYVGLRIWTYQYPYIYVIQNENLSHIFYIINSLLGFSFLITYSYIYFKTVYKLENELTKMANLDPLTGIYNRRKMKEILKFVQDEQEKHQYQITIALLDVDMFKQINDTYGHDIGDIVLIKLSEILQEKHKENEHFFISRWGGEEFLIFYERYNKNQNEVFEEFDELRKKIENTLVNENIHFTVTIGLAFYDKNKTINSLIKEADEKLYKGKNNGRNQVVV